MEEQGRGRASMEEDHRTEGTVGRSITDGYGRSNRTTVVEWCGGIGKVLCEEANY